MLNPMIPLMTATIRKLRLNRSGSVHTVHRSPVKTMSTKIKGRLRMLL